MLERPTAWIGELVARKPPEPSYPTLPRADENGQSSVEGIYLVGEIAGTPLIKLGLNAGVAAIDAIASELSAAEPDAAAGDGGEVLDVVIVGAGSAGLGAAARAGERGLSYVVLEARRAAQTVIDMYAGKWLFAEPTDVDNQSALWFEECTRETLLERWRTQIAELGLSIHEHEAVDDIRGHGGAFEVRTAQASYRARRVVLAMGKAGNPRKAGVPGEREHAARIHHVLSDPAALQGERVFIYGGGDVALEAALALCQDNRVTLVTVDRELTYPKKRNREALLARAEAAELELHLSSRLEAIEDGSVRFVDADGRQQRRPADTVFEMIGSELPLSFFERVGIELEGRWNIRRWLALAGLALAVYTLYALKKYPESPYSWPFDRLLPAEGFAAATGALFEATFWPFRGLFEPEAYQQIRQTLWFQQGYLYSLLYTVVMVVFGYQAFRRWTGIARDPRYQTYRYASLVAFQVVFFLVANVIAVKALSVQHAWRAWGLYQPWPLFFNTFNWWGGSSQALIYFFVGAGLFGTLVVIPWAAHRHGKRFCTFVCGCGGLAETLGDRYRHLAAKGRRSRLWEFQGVVILVAAALATFVTVGAFGTRADNLWAQSYSYLVDFWLVAVIPIALYPFYGGKVWCRYWCPLAAYNGLLARWYGKLEIRSNDKCISCTQCSKYCQVGVDVMAFAKNQESFDNRNSSCIQCGICIDVCPVQVLSFAQSDDGKRRLPLAPD